MTPVNGTPDKPNREKVMRSPSVLIGGLYWNIKYFPRGNDGTEQMSVYIECSSSPDGPESEDDSDTENSANEANGMQASGEAPTDAPTEERNDPSHAVSSDVDVTSDANQQAPEVTKTPTAEEAKETVPWEAAAQVGCIVYNPNEPRVNAFRKSHHRFTKDNPDWGWTRFHGPWETIHLRQRLDRQALLRNDTLAFTAFIRTVKDDTKSLWWHAAKQGSDWDSQERIGVKSLATTSSKDNAIVATISCWLHLNPIVEMIKNMRIPDAATDPTERNRPLFAALQQLLDYMFNPLADKEQKAMGKFILWLDWYITDTQMSRTDLSVPIAVWESVRRVLNCEASGTGDMSAAADMFHDILLLKQPDPWKDESPILSPSYVKSSEAAEVSKSEEPRSVQETVDLASFWSNPFRVWSGFDGQSAKGCDYPAVLQVELHRHAYDKEARKWNKLTHHIEINETITYTAPKTGAKCGYTLYGFIVETGSLASQDCYSVIRPSGPGTRWIRYSGNKNYRGASCLTTTQAIAAHEGKGRNATGDAAVAHVVLYVRTDHLPAILSQPQPVSPSPPFVTESVTSPEDTDAGGDRPVRIYNSTLFNSHIGRGLPDLWSPASDDGASQILDLRLPKAASIPQAIENMDEGFLKDTETSAQHKTCVMWYLDFSWSTVQGLPHMISGVDTVEEHISRNQGCHIWFHMEDSQSLAEDMSTAILQDDQSGETQPAVTDQHGGGDEPEDTVMTQDPPVEESTESERAPMEDTTRTEEAPFESSIQIDEAQVDTQPPAGPASPVAETQRLVGDDVSIPAPQEGDDGNADGDATMDEVQEPTHAAEPDQHPAPTPRLKDLIYIFVKIFDLQTQELRGIGSKMVWSEGDVHTEVGRILGTEDAMEIYLEKGRIMWEDDQIHPSRTFSYYGLQSGSILVAHRRPSSEE